MPGTRRVAGLEASLKSRLAQLKSDRMPLLDEGGASRRECKRYCSVVRRPLNSRPVATAGPGPPRILAFEDSAKLLDFAHLKHGAVAPFIYPGGEARKGAGHRT